MSNHHLTDDQIMSAWLWYLAKNDDEAYSPEHDDIFNKARLLRSGKDLQAKVATKFGVEIAELPDDIMLHCDHRDAGCSCGVYNCRFDWFITKVYPVLIIPDPKGSIK